MEGVTEQQLALEVAKLRKIEEYQITEAMKKRARDVSLI